jgi:hypothetical protein
MHRLYLDWIKNTEKLVRSHSVCAYLNGFVERIISPWKTTKFRNLIVLVATGQYQPGLVNTIITQTTLDGQERFPGYVPSFIVPTKFVAMMNSLILN